MPWLELVQQRCKGWSLLALWSIDDSEATKSECHAHPSSYLCLFSRSAPSTILSNLIFRQSIVHVICSFYHTKIILRFVHFTCELLGHSIKLPPSLLSSLSCLVPPSLISQAGCNKRLGFRKKIVFPPLERYLHQLMAK